MKDSVPEYLDWSNAFEILEKPHEQGIFVLVIGPKGTGKTSLSADPDRMLIGDDEHGWSDKNIFNLGYKKRGHISASPLHIYTQI